MCCDDHVCFRTLTTDQIGKEVHMKAIVQDKYGAPNAVLKLRDIDKPVVKDNEVLV